MSDLAGLRLQQAEVLWAIGDQAQARRVALASREALAAAAIPADAALETWLRAHP